MDCRVMAGVMWSALFALTGCNSGYTPDAGVIVTGKIVQGGQPIAIAGAIPGYGKVEVRVVELTTGSSIDAAGCDASGNFELVHGGGGIPPGKYKLAIVALKDPSTDLLEGKLNEQTTPIEIDVPKEKLGGKHDIGTIDVATHLK